MSSRCDVSADRLDGKNYMHLVQEGGGRSNRSPGRPAKRQRKELSAASDASQLSADTLKSGEPKDAETPSMNTPQSSPLKQGKGRHPEVASPGSIGRAGLFEGYKLFFWRVPMATTLTNKVQMAVVEYKCCTYICLKHTPLHGKRQGFALRGSRCVVGQAFIGLCVPWSGETLWSGNTIRPRRGHIGSHSQRGHGPTDAQTTAGRHQQACSRT